MRKAFTLFPLLVVPVLIYNLIAFSAGGETAAGLPPVLASLDAVFFEMPMISGVSWRFEVSDTLLFLGLGVLFVEIVKSTSTRSAAIANHAASMFLLVFCLIEFLMVRNFATATFFLLTIMCFLDVLAGVMVTIVSARRDFGVNGEIAH